MYPILIGAGLYKKKIGFSSSDKHDDAVKRITDVYPRLATCDGFALHKSRDGGIKRPLQKLIQGGMMLSNYGKNATQKNW